MYRCERSLPPGLPVPLKVSSGHLSCIFFLEAIMGKAAVPLSLFGLLLTVVTALPVRVRGRLIRSPFLGKETLNCLFCAWIT